MIFRLFTYYADNKYGIGFEAAGYHFDLIKSSEFLKPVNGEITAENRNIADILNI